ncbi:integrin alpha-PS1 isoform X2 [Achroia grisella]|uniref:integrin alpha-PS1 isoform X2 n=1 Tax=Achroia grisella TaxID=688607 RepID=UPI0027D2A285|nr:integrin alpha-PS1 isoform X2 [Achroia grisella]
MMATKFRRCVCLFYYIFNIVYSFNLEPRIPVIKYGEAGSYFGFSVAEHLTFNSDGSKTSWLLVGAPLGKNLQPNITKSGALFKCGLTSADWDCEQVITDGKSNPDGYNLTEPHSDEQKKGQWLGVSVRSQGPGKKAVVCAHRYIRKVLEAQYGQGLCYTLTNELKLIDAWEPCRGRPVVREHEEYGYCQAGTSSSLLEDDTLVMGSPGPYTWRGTLFVSDAKDDLLERDNTVYLAPVEDGQSPVEKYSYLGMSVVGAKFFDKSKSSYAAGAPRSRGTGQVVFFSKREIQNWTLTNVDFLGQKGIIDGEQFGSSFGYEVSAADVNGDGLPDLLVGAPFYFSRDTGGAVYLYLNRQYTFNSTYDVKLTGAPESQFGISIANAGDLNKDGCEDIAIGSPYAGNGEVYIYLGDRKNGLNTKPDQIIKAEDLPRHMKTFGYSLSGGTDLDGNGYPDLLIGAYENSSVALIRTRPIIDIKTWVVPSKIVNIDPALQSCEIDPDSNNTCFYFQACCVIKSLVESIESNTHRLNYVIEAETFANERKFSRVFFDSNNKNIVNNTITLGKNVEHCTEHVAYLKNNTRDIQTPIRIRLTYMLEHVQPQYSTFGSLPNIDEYPVLNATATTTFSASFLNDCGEDGVCISDLVVIPVLLNADDKSSTLILGEEEEIKLAIDVNNYGDSAYEAQLFVQHSPNLHYIAANITDKRLICGSVNKTIVSCMLENPFKQQPIGTPPIVLRFDTRMLEDNDPSVSFTVWANSTSKELHPHKIPVEVKAVVKKNAELTIRGVAVPEHVFYGGAIKGESAMKYFDDIGPAVVHKYQVTNEGRWRVSSVQVHIEWPHQMQSNEKQGKWLLYPEEIAAIDDDSGHVHGRCFAQESELNPLNLTMRAESPLENLEMDPMLKFKKLEENSEKKYNQTKKAYSYSSAVDNRVRRRRDADIVATAEAYNGNDVQRKNIKTISCNDKKTAKCLIFQCIIYPLERKQEVSITIKARLWNSTLVAEYSQYSHVSIFSTASIDIPDHYNIHQVRSDNKATVETVSYPALEKIKSNDVPLWVIIISVLIGLIVLILVILLLWKCGFFKRSRPDPTLSGNLEKNNHEASPLFIRNS